MDSRSNLAYMSHQLLSGLSIPTGGISSLAHTKVNGSCTQVHMRTSRCLCSGVETNLLNFGLSTLAAENSNRNCRLPMLSADPEKCRLSLPHLHLQDFNSAFSPTHHRVLPPHGICLRVEFLRKTLGVSSSIASFSHLPSLY